jgi:hypothetical protein
MNVRSLSVWMLAAVLGTVGCHRAASQGEVGQKAEEIGMRDLTNASPEAMRKWFSQHRSEAAELKVICELAQSTAEANWADTPEGRMCSAAKQASFMNPPPGGVKSDGRTFRPGTH